MIGWISAGLETLENKPQSPFSDSAIVECGLANVLHFDSDQQQTARILKSLLCLCSLFEMGGTDSGGFVPGDIVPTLSERGPPIWSSAVWTKPGSVFNPLNLLRAEAFWNNLAGFPAPPFSSRLSLPLTVLPCWCLTSMFTKLGRSHRGLSVSRDLPDFNRLKSSFIKHNMAV